MLMLHSPRYWLIGMFAARPVVMNADGSLGAFGRQRSLPELLRRPDGVQGAADHLAGAGSMGLFGQTVLKEFGIGQDDPELVVQEMEELGQVVVGTGPRVQSGHGVFRRD